MWLELEAKTGFYKECKIFSIINCTLVEVLLNNASLKSSGGGLQLKSPKCI